MAGQATFIGIVCSVTILAAGAVWADPAPPRLTENQAIQIASDFCQRIGAPVSVAGNAVYPAAQSITRQPMEPDEYWLPRWVVTFPAEAQVEVVDETGIVRSYMNNALEAQLGKQPGGIAIAGTAAIRSAVAALRATGQPFDEIRPNGAVIYGTDRQYRAAGHTWWVSWTRTYKSVPYEHQSAQVGVQAETGKIVALGLTFPSPPPGPSEVHLTARDGAEKALARLAQRGVQTALIYQEDAEYVVPDESQLDSAATADSLAPDESQRNGTVNKGNPPVDFVTPRLAWVARAVTEGYPMDEWIDAETGTVIGETTHVPGGPVAPPKGRRTAAQILTDAKEIKIERRTDKYDWPNTPTAVLSETSQPKMFKLLKASEPSSIKNLLVAPEFQLEVATSSPGTTKLYYLPDRNLVGDGVNWLTAPAGFQTWMEKLGGKGAKDGMK